MPALHYYNIALGILFISALLSFVALFFIKAPYGRHQRSGWGHTISSRTGWIIMEVPSVLLFLLVFMIGPHRNNVVSLVLLSLWQLHYIYRTFIFPFRLRTTRKPMPIAIVGLGFSFNGLNSFINAFYLTSLVNYSITTLTSLHFLLGVFIFMLGFMINHRSDHILFNLRKPGETGYKIPQGFLYRWISSPNYLGEIIEWSGFALAAFSLPALGFALYTIANLLPRALAHQQWYRQQFPNYPATRKALIPYLL